MDGRLGNAVEGLIVAVIAVALAALIAAVVRLISKRRIGTSTYYFCAIVVGYILYRALIVIYVHPHKSAEEPASASSSNSLESVGLDAPFIAPPESQLESFPVQLDKAIASLPVDEKAALTEALEFLSFATAKNLEEKDSAAFEKLTESDLAAKTFAKLYRFAEGQGSAMTLRKYIELSQEFRKQEPESWEMFKAGKERAKLQK